MKYLILLSALFVLSCTKKAENIFSKPPNQHGERYGVSGEDEPANVDRIFMVIWDGDKLVAEFYSSGYEIWYDTLPDIVLKPKP